MPGYGAIEHRDQSMSMLLNLRMPAVRLDLAERGRDVFVWLALSLRYSALLLPQSLLKFSDLDT